ncbi:tyrosine-type recombinase/integrase [Glaesserella sp.]|uniref:tyrosine-type recombinase/integrase n=1 Tax=Glaesserella sp. TaxID=2094731 RepID=UPI0035A04747
MARITKPLTNTEIDKSKPKDKDYTLTDGQGLYLLIKANGAKLWRFNYYKPTTNKKRALIGLGAYPEISLAKAREIRETYRTLLAQGIDPQTHRLQQEHQKTLAQVNTFGKVAEQWKEKKEGEIEPKTLKKYWASLSLHVLPYIENYPITDILPTLIIPVLRKVEERGALDMVHRLSQYINDILKFAVNNGFIPFNPCSNIASTFKKHRKSNNPRISSEELPELMRKLSTAQIELQTQLLIQFQLLTMVRGVEAREAKWEEIDFTDKLWIIPAERMKSREVHKVPLSTQAIKVLERLKQFTGHYVYLFPKRTNPREPMSNATANTALKRMGYDGKQTAHGLRGLARTYLAEQGITHEHAEACLAHKTGGNVSLAYNHSTYLEQRKSIMQLWGDYVERCSTVSTL